MIESKGKVLTLSQMGVLIKGNGKVISNKDSELILSQTEVLIKESGKMIK